MQLKKILLACLVSTAALGETKVRNAITQGAVVNVLDKGADPTGATFSTTAIQAAIDASVRGKTVYFPANGGAALTTYKIGELTVAAGSTAELVCDAAGSVVLSYTGATTALTVGTTAADTSQFTLRNCGIDLGGASAGANALKTIRVTGGTIERVSITGTTGATTLGVGVILDGTNSYSGNIAFKRVTVTGNYTKGIHCLGAAGTNTCNHHSFDTVTIARTTAKPGTGTIGFHWGVNAGDGVLLGPDVEGYDTAYQVDGAYLRGTARCENNTVCVAFGAASFDSVIFLQPFSNTTNVTYAGGQAFNSVWMPDGFEINMNNGSVGGSAAFRERTDRSATVSVQAGATADQDRILEWRDRTGTSKFRARAGSGGSFFLEDMVSGIPRFFFNAANNDPTDIRASGSGAIQLNKNTGTGGSCFGDGAGNCKATIDSGGRVVPGAFTNATLGTPANGNVVYCSDCTIANPCAGGGTGAIAKRLNGAWICN